MRRKTVVRLALTGAALFVGAVALAADDPNEVREANAIGAMQSANAMSVRDGAYLQTRDLLLAGTSSIKAKLESWETGMQQWMAGWNGILALMQLQNNVPFSTFESTLTSQLNTQATKFDALIRLAGDLKRQGTAALVILGDVPKPAASTYPNVDSFRPVIDGLGAREVDVKTAVTSMSTMADAKLTVMRQIDTNTRVAVITRLRAALLATGRYPLEQTIKAVQELLDAQRVVEPLLAQLGKIENDLDRNAINLQIFHANDGIVDARAKCTEITTALDNVVGATKYVNAARSRLNTLCSHSESHLQSLVALGVSNAELVTEYLGNQRPLLQNACKNAARPSPSCENLATLGALESADLSAMDDAHLKFVEYGWADHLAVARQKGTGQ